MAPGVPYRPTACRSYVADMRQKSQRLSFHRTAKKERDERQPAGEEARESVNIFRVPLLRR